MADREPTETDERDHECDALRVELRESIMAAIAAVRRAGGALEDLAGNRLYDVEYAESTQGRDLGAFLDDAARALRAAAALNHLCAPPAPPGSQN